MAKIVYLYVPKGTVVVTPLDLANKKIVSLFEADGNMVVARYGTNKSTLKKLLAKETKNG